MKKGYKALLTTLLLFGCSNSNNPTISPIPSGIHPSPVTSITESHIFKGYLGFTIRTDISEYSISEIVFDTKELTMKGHFKLFDEPNNDFPLYFETSNKENSGVGEAIAKEKTFTRFDSMTIEKEMHKGFDDDNSFTVVLDEKAAELLNQTNYSYYIIYTDFGLGNINFYHNKKEVLNKCAGMYEHLLDEKLFDEVDFLNVFYEGIHLDKEQKKTTF